MIENDDYFQNFLTETIIRIKGNQEEISLNSIKKINSI